MSNEDYGRARDAIAALGLTGANKRVAGHWLSRWQRGQPPRLAEFNRGRDFESAPAISIFEVRQDTALRCVSAGAFVTLASGFDLTNQDVISITSAGLRDERMAIAWAIATGSVSVYYRKYKSQKGSSGVAQGMGLPLADIKLDSSRLFLLHNNWRPVGEDWMVGNVDVDLQVPAEKKVVRFTQEDTAGVALV